MPFVIPTTEELKNQFLDNLESSLNQTVPDVDKAFLKVLSATEALQGQSLFKYAVDRALANLAITARDDDLDLIGSNYGVPRKPAIAAQFTIGTDVDTTGGSVTIPAATEYVGELNNIRYTTNEEVIAEAPATTVQLNVTAVTGGSAGNLTAGDVLTILSPIANLGDQAEVSAFTSFEIVIGVDEEGDETYRRRVLNEIRTIGGGGNGVDYRTWSEAVVGVNRAFPYSGRAIEVVPLLDGDMEELGVADWGVGNSATLTKEVASPYEGSQNLRITYNAVNNPYAYQDILERGKYYHITGAFRGDAGTAFPRILQAGGQLLYEGTVSTTWQTFDFNFLADTRQIWFGSNANAGGEFVEYDAIVIEQLEIAGDRVVYIEATSDIDPDGIAPQNLLDTVRDNINNDPDTGRSRPPLGDTNENLFVESIFRTGFTIEIRELTVPADKEFDAKNDIEAALTNYFFNAVPYVEGVDPLSTRNDTLTDLSVSSIVQDVLQTYSGSAAGITLTETGSSSIPSYQLGRGEMAKLDNVTYI
jgi:hypothetical protein